MVFWQFSDVMIDVWIKIIDSNLDAVILKGLCKIIGMKYNKSIIFGFSELILQLIESIFYLVVYFGVKNNRKMVIPKEKCSRLETSELQVWSNGNKYCTKSDKLKK